MGTSGHVPVASRWSRTSRRFSPTIGWHPAARHASACAGEPIVHDCTDTTPASRRRRARPASRRCTCQVWNGLVARRSGTPKAPPYMNGAAPATRSPNASRTSRAIVKCIGALTITGARDVVSRSVRTSAPTPRRLLISTFHRASDRPGCASSSANVGTGYPSRSRASASDNRSKPRRTPNTAWCEIRSPRMGTTSTWNQRYPSSYAPR